MPYYDDELIDRAVSMYFRTHYLRGYQRMQINQPGRHCCSLDGNVVTLANSYTVLARYQVIRDPKDPDRVRFRKIEPSDIPHANADPNAWHPRSIRRARRLRTQGS